jgi:outer membrane protein assembly factor BamB
MNALLLVLALATPQVPDLGTRKAGHDWPGFLGPKRDGVSLETGLDPRWPATGPRLVWHRELGEGFGACAVSRGRVLQFDRLGGKARLVCLKSETGEPLWTFEYPTDYSDAYGAGDGPRTCPLFDGDRVFIVDPAGLLHCVGLGDGKLLWKKDTGSDFGVVPNFFGVGSTPVVEGDLLLCMVGGSPPNSPAIGQGGIEGNGTGIVAFETATGKVRYKITDELASYSSPVTATIAGRRWGFVFARGGLVGFEPSTGKMDFHYPWRARAITTVNICTPVVAGDLVYVSEAYGIGASVLRVKPGGYDVLWQDGRKRDQSMATYFGTPVHVGGFLYGSSGQGKSEAELRCVEMATGKVAWSEPGLGRTSLTSVDGHLIALSEDGTLRLLRTTPTKFEVVAKAVIKSPAGERLLGEPAWAAPVLSHGLLYVRGRDRLVCLDLIPER